MSATRFRPDRLLRLALPMVVASALVGVTAYSQGPAAPTATNPIHERVTAIQKALLSGGGFAPEANGLQSPEALRKRAFAQAVRVVANTRIPKEFLEIGKQRRAQSRFVAAPKAAGPLPANFDWRSQKKVTPVRTYLGNTGQDGCGCCWCFAGVSTFEDSLLILASGDPATLDASEQFILDSGQTGGCNGDWYWTAWKLMENPGTCSEADDPYKGYPDVAEGVAKAGVPKPYKVADFQLVSDTQRIPSVSDMKQALVQHGPLAVAVYVDDGFTSYPAGGDVFKGFPNNPNVGDPINHAITLIGWDDSKNAWLIKNSWGNAWGSTGGMGTERGYMWIDYNSNNIGYAACWVRAETGQ